MPKQSTRGKARGGVLPWETPTAQTGAQIAPLENGLT